MAYLDGATHWVSLDDAVRYWEEIAPSEVSKPKNIKKDAERNDMRELDQSVFDGQPPEVTLACVDYDGLLKFGKNVQNYRYTWASERWRGADWIEKRGGTDYEPLTSIRRDTPNK
jgi:hypothetical protein